MKIAYATDKGLARTDNQDYVDVFTNKVGTQLAIVADGVGGENGGDVAATMAVSHLGNQWRESEVADVVAGQRWLSEMTIAENETILNTANRYRTLRGMATTIIIAIILADQVVVANLGDSRAYLIRQGDIRQLTEDHNLAGELLRQGAITESEAADHPGRNLITRQLGVNDDVSPDVQTLALQAGDILLLTTDGMPKVLTDDQVLTTVRKEEDIAKIVSTLINETNQAGGPDNVTVLVGYQESEGQ
jgi:protein phosphatase